jgi:hypothetical protein
VTSKGLLATYRKLPGSTSTWSQPISQPVSQPISSQSSQELPLPVGGSERSYLRSSPSPESLPTSLPSPILSSRLSRSILAVESSVEREVLRVATRGVESLVLFRDPWRISEGMLDRIFNHSIGEARVRRKDLPVVMSTAGRRYVSAFIRIF